MEEAPNEGSWYETETGEIFMVVKVDPGNGLAEVQYLNGKPDQIDRTIWSDLDLTQVEPPDEWRADMDTFFHERGRKKH
jgi:hypothetical protein